MNTVFILLSVTHLQGIPADGLSPADTKVLQKLLSPDTTGDRAALVAELSQPQLRDQAKALLPEIEAAIARRPKIRQLVDEVKKAGGKTKLVKGGPDWLRKAVGDRVMEVFDRPQEIDFSDRRTQSQNPDARNEKITDAWLSKLDGFDSLQHLNLTHCDLRGSGLRHVGNLTHLKSLDLSYTPIADDALAFLAGLVELEHLSLASTACKGSGFGHLHALKNLTDLDLSRTPTDDTGVAQLKGLEKLERLTIVRANFTDASAASFGALKSLKELDLSSTDPACSDAVLSHLGGLPLVSLHLSGEQATVKGLSCVSGVPTLKSLTLSQASNPMVPVVAMMPALEALTINGKHLNDEGILHLIGAKSLKSLTVTAATSSISEETVKKLKAAHPGMALNFRRVGMKPAKGSSK